MSDMEKKTADLKKLIAERTAQIVNGNRRRSMPCESPEQVKELFGEWVTAETFECAPEIDAAVEIFEEQTASLQSSLSEKEAEIERLRGALEEKTAKVLPVEGKKHPFQSIMDHAEETEPEIKAALNSNGFWDMLDDNPVSEGKEDEQEIIKDLLEDIEIMRGKTSTRHVIVKVIMERYHITRK
jgi:hypothetical protein